MLHPDQDGDLLAVGSLSVGRLLQAWGHISDTGEQVERVYTEPALYLADGTELFLHRSHAVAKVAAVTMLHAVHYMTTMLLFAQLAVLLNPVVLLPLVLCRGHVYSRLVRYADGMAEDAKRARAKFMFATYYDVLVSIGVHIYLWLVLVFLLLFVRVEFNADLALGMDDIAWANWTALTVGKGVAYLAMSELCLYGFLLHPYMGYFVGVHRSGGEGFKDKGHPSRQGLLPGRDAAHGQCQPTMSTYSTLAALSTMNLTYATVGTSCLAPPSCPQPHVILPGDLARYLVTLHGSVWPCAPPCYLTRYRLTLCTLVTLHATL